MRKADRFKPDVSPEAAGTIPLLCISVAGSDDRRIKMLERFAEMGLLERVYFVQAIDGASELVDRYLARGEIKQVSENDRTAVARWLSHIRALSTFLHQTGPETTRAIVLEDDVLLHRDWHDRLASLVANLPPDASVCSLAYHDDPWAQGVDESSRTLPWAGRVPGRRNLVPLASTLSSAYIYMTSRRHARRVLLERKSTPGHPVLGPDSVVRWPDALEAFPALAIRDDVPSTVRREWENHAHQRVHNGREAATQSVDDAPEPTLPEKVRNGNQTICLCMVIWNQRHLVERLAASLTGIIDTWVICDAGSTDGTPKRVAKAFSGLSGELYHDEWHDYGTNRTLMLERARGKADYLLVLDADHLVRLKGPIPMLKADAYSLPVNDALTEWEPRLLRADLPWRYVGSTNEDLVCNHAFRVQPLRALVAGRDGNPADAAERLRRDRELLERDLDEDPNDPRTVFYLAQTCRDMGDEQRAAKLYARRAQLGGSPDEIFYARYQHAELVSRYDWGAGVALLLDCWQDRPSRAEPLYALARGYRMRNEFRLARLFAGEGVRIPIPEGAFLLHRDQYEWGLPFEWSLACYWTGDLEQALRADKFLLKVKSLPEEIREAVGENRRRIMGLKAEYRAEAMSTASLATTTLQSVVPETQIGELMLTLDRSWTQSSPSIASGVDGCRVLLRTSELAEEGAAYRVVYHEVELADDLSFDTAGPVSDESLPARVSIGDLRHCRLIRLGSDWVVAGDAPSGGLSGRSQVVMRLVDGRFADYNELEGSESERDQSWAPFVVDDQLLFVASWAPTVVFRCDVASGGLDPLATTAASSDFADERGASAGVKVQGGTLFLTRREAPETDEHRFVLLSEDFRIAAVGPWFCLLASGREACTGMTIHGVDLVLSFDRNGDRAYLARLPYEAVRASLSPLSPASLAPPG